MCYIKSKKSNLYYTRYTTPKRVTNLLGPSPCHCARATQLLTRRNVVPVASHWLHCGRFDRPEMSNSDLPFYRRTFYRPTEGIVTNDYTDCRRTKNTISHILIPYIYASYANKVKIYAKTTIKKQQNKANVP